jgi:hypothetical protein
MITTVRRHVALAMHKRGCTGCLALSNLRCATSGDSRGEEDGDQDQRFQKAGEGLDQDKHSPQGGRRAAGQDSGREKSQANKQANTQEND